MWPIPVVCILCSIIDKDICRLCLNWNKREEHELAWTSDVEESCKSAYRFYTEGLSI